MADAKITELTELAATPDGSDILPIVDDPSGSPATKKITVTNLLAAASGASCVSIGPWPAGGTSFTLDTLAMSTNTTGYTGAFILPFSITVNKLSIFPTTVGAAGTYDIGVYSEDGQTKQIDITTASISAGGTAVTTAVSAVSLSAGVHYIVVVPNSTANVTFRVWTPDIEGKLLDTITSEPKLMGVQTVTASTLPSTFNPASDLSVSARKELIWFRLDN